MKRKKKILGQIRHILTAIGLYLVATGKLDDPGMQEILGVAMSIIGHAWSWFAPEKKDEA